jgi:phosphoribosylaminoimidazole-succinocarboxamide synthase
MLGTTTLAEGLALGSPLAAPMMAPVIRRAHGFDPEPVSRSRALAETGLAAATYDAIEAMSCLLFARGRDLATRREAALIDTLYSFGTLRDGTVIVDALVHSPHVSRYRLLSPDRRIDREFDEAGPITERQRREPRETELPRDLRLELARGYLELGTRFIADFEPHAGPVKNRLAMSLSSVGLLA